MQTVVCTDSANRFYSSPLIGGEWLASRSDCLIPGKELQIPTLLQARYAQKMSGLGSEEKELCQL